MRDRYGMVLTLYQLIYQKFMVVGLSGIVST